MSYQGYFTWSFFISLCSNILQIATNFFYFRLKMFALDNLIPHVCVIFHFFNDYKTFIWHIRTFNRLYSYFHDLHHYIYTYIVMWWSNEKEKIPHCQNDSKLNIKIVEKGKIDTPSTNIYDRSLTWLGTCDWMNIW
jgi:hypothetical protein